jgi:hypothetical protein
MLEGSMNDDNQIASPRATPAAVVVLADHRAKSKEEEAAAPRPWTIADIRRIYAPTFKSLPYVQRDEGASLCDHPATFWNDTPGFDHKADHKRGRVYAAMTIEAVAADNCDSRPLEQVFEAIIMDAVARKIKGGKHARTLPPAVDGFLWELSKFIAKAATSQSSD